MEKNETVYAPGVYIKLVGKFNILNAKINVKEFMTFLEQHTNDKGYCNISIVPRKVATEYGITHYVKLNTWEPNPEYENKTTTNMNSNVEAEDCGDMPF